MVTSRRSCGPGKLLTMSEQISSLKTYSTSQKLPTPTLYLPTSVLLKCWTAKMRS